jgi:signal transduction histidine kinase/HPt (histidine-containing phosphotransfer) domain-containing protein
LPKPTKSLLARVTRRGSGEPPAPPAPVAATSRLGWRRVAAALALSVAGVSAPIAVTVTAATTGALGPPLAMSALAALLVLAPAGVGLATVLSGLRRVAAVLAVRADSEGEQAVLRVLVDAVVFFYALGLAAVSPNAGAPPYLAVAALALIVAWAVLLQVILWPAAPLVRRIGAMALDIVLFSAFLHFGGHAVAGWYPLYLLAILYAGFRFGRGALSGTASLSILGFGAVVLATDAWRQQPVLAAGLIVALAALPGFIAGAMGNIASAREAGAEGEADRRQVLLLIADNLRGPLATIGAALALGGRLTPSHQPDEPALTAHAARVIATQINDVRDLAALEAGTFAPPVEAFNLRALVTRSLGPLQAIAAEGGVALRWRVDPHLPSRLRGRAQALARILASLAGHSIDATDAGTVRIALDAAGRDARRIRLSLLVETTGANPGPELEPVALLLVRHLVALIGGTFAIEHNPGQRTRLAATLALAIDEGAPEPALDLGERPMLIVSEDEEFASTFAEPLAAWNGDARWVGDADAALAALARREATGRPVMIVDGRRKLLSALSLAHHAARLGDMAPFVLLVADPAQIENLGEVDEGEVDGFIPLPLSEQLLANALHALPLMAERPATLRLADPPRGPPGELAPQRSQQITPIASHPKFVSEAPAALDMRAIDGLRELGGDPAFLGELIETFQIDVEQIMRRLDQAAAAADAAGFARGLAALRRAASSFGAIQLCEILASLQGLTASELRQLGAIHMQRLDAEIERLAAALIEIAAASDA